MWTRGFLLGALLVLLLLVLWMFGIRLIPALPYGGEIAIGLVGLVVVSIVGMHLTGGLLVSALFAVGVMLSMLGGATSTWLVRSGHGALPAFLVSTVFDVAVVVLLITSIVLTTRAFIRGTAPNKRTS